MEHSSKTLRKWLEGFEYKDFHNGRIPRGGPSKDGDLFITDYHGNDLSLCQKIKCKNPRSWTDEVDFICTLIPDCLDKYGSSINGPFKIPEELK